MKAHDTMLIDRLVCETWEAKQTKDVVRIAQANEEIKAVWNAGKITIFQRDALWRILLSSDDSSRYARPS